jgi:hypothetical protein
MSGGDGESQEDRSCRYNAGMPCPEVVVASKGWRLAIALTGQVDGLILEDGFHPPGRSEGFDARGRSLDRHRAQRVRPPCQPPSIVSLENGVDVRHGSLGRFARGLYGCFALGTALTLAAAARTACAKQNKGVDLVPRFKASQTGGELGANFL